MTYTLMTLYLMLATMFWFSISLLMDLILLILSILVGSYLISTLFLSSWTSYLIILAIVGGLMVLYSFIVMMNPNLIEVIIVPKYFSYFVTLTLFCLILLVNYMSMEFYSIEFYLNFTLDQYVLMNYCSVYPFISLYLYLIMILLMMLFIVDFLVCCYSGSLLSI